MFCCVKDLCSLYVWADFISNGTLNYIKSDWGDLMWCVCSCTSCNCSSPVIWADSGGDGEVQESGEELGDYSRQEALRLGWRPSGPSDLCGPSLDRMEATGKAKISVGITYVYIKSCRPTWINSNLLVPLLINLAKLLCTISCTIRQYNL